MAEVRSAPALLGRAPLVDVVGSRPARLAGSAVAEQMRLSHGRSHISCFSAAGDKEVVLLPGGAAVAFRVAAGVAVVAGDPLGRPEQVPDAVEEFVALCRRQGWAPCFYQTAPSMREAYRRCGLRLITFGEEAVADRSGWLQPARPAPGQPAARGGARPPRRPDNDSAQLVRCRRRPPRRPRSRLQRLAQPSLAPGDRVLTRAVRRDGGQVSAAHHRAHAVR